MYVQIVWLEWYYEYEVNEVFFSKQNESIHGLLKEFTAIHSKYSVWHIIHLSDGRGVSILRKIAFEIYQNMLPFHNLEYTL